MFHLDVIRLTMYNDDNCNYSEPEGARVKVPPLFFVIIIIIIIIIICVFCVLIFLLGYKA